MNQETHLLRGLLHCEASDRTMLALHAPGGCRIYSCGVPDCPTPDLDAATVEADLLLAALIRGAVTMYPEYATTKAVAGHRELEALRADQPLVDQRTMARWQSCEITDRRQVVTTAFARIDVSSDGELRPVWRDADVPAGAGS